MFDSMYLLEDHSQSRNRFAVALVATVALLGMAGTALLAAERLQIKRVEGPQLSQHVLFMPVMPIVPEAEVEKPPKAPEGGSSSPALTPTRESIEEPDRGPPDPTPRIKPELRAPKHVGPRGVKIPGPTPGPPKEPGDRTGGDCKGPDCTGIGGPTKPKPLTPLILKPSQIQCISCPDPSSKMIRQMAGARLRSGKNVTRFCVGTAGRVESAKTTKSSGDRQVDAFVKKTVQAWRLRPYRVDGRARRACTTASFDIQVR